MNPPNLKTQADGRRYAFQVLDQLAHVGREKCRGDRPGNSPSQHAGLIRAWLNLRRGTTQAAIGFCVVLTDRIGSRVYGVDSWDYREMERCGRFRHWADPKRPGKALLGMEAAKYGK